MVGARTVLVRHHGTLDLDTLTGHLGAAVPTTGASPDHTVEIDVVYDGEDLAEVARLTGLTRDEVVAAHAESSWTVGFTGFAPGFGYLVGGDPRLRVPRRGHPRQSVPAGSVALAGEFCGLYPRESPGGWQLIGRTDAPLWDIVRDPPALLVPGSSVRFRPVPALRRRPAAESTMPAMRPGVVDATRGSLHIDDPGPLCLVQDLGRPGLAHLGVGRSGAADRGALVAANRLVGNPAGSAAMEVTLGGLRFTPTHECVIGCAGARLPLALRHADGAVQQADAFGGAIRVPGGTQVRLGRPAVGVRTYLAIRGGLDVAPVLDSRSTDTLSGIGPPPVRRGEELPVGGIGAEPDRPADQQEPDRPPDEPPDGPDGPDRATVLDVVLGPRADWFAPDAADTLLGTTWQVGVHADRVGIHLDGPRLIRSRDDELPSEGMVPGAIQVPASGRPVIFGIDHPVTGGYPVIAVLTTEAVDRAAQLRPGRTVRFRAIPRSTG